MKALGIDVEIWKRPGFKPLLIGMIMFVQVYPSGRFSFNNPDQY